MLSGPTRDRAVVRSLLDHRAIRGCILPLANFVHGQNDLTMSSGYFAS
jgi:hypothetical protein